MPATQRPRRQPAPRRARVRRVLRAKVGRGDAWGESPDVTTGRCMRPVAFEAPATARATLRRSPGRAAVVGGQYVPAARARPGTIGRHQEDDAAREVDDGADLEIAAFGLSLAN